MDELKKTVSTKPERLQKILSANGISSRREAEKMISDGRVIINGLVATLGQCAIPGVDEILVDGETLAYVDKFIYLMLNKPLGYLSTVKDERGRLTVMELVSDAGGRVYPVGRLDLNSEGLLLFTNDGDFANAVMHPSYNINKTYEVKVRGDIKKSAELLRLPISIDSYTVHALDIKIAEETEKGGRLLIKITEGRNRQVRKMCAACGLTVDGLKRVSIGDLELGDLETGKWRKLTEEEVTGLWLSTP